MFIGREKELKLFNENYEKPNSNLNFIIGRKNIGKTALILEYAKEKGYLYMNEIEQIPYLFFNSMAKKILKYFSMNTEYSHSYDSFLDILKLLSSCKIDEKLILVFDDFNVLSKVDKEALKVLLMFWDRELKYKNLQIFILSSYMFEIKDEKNISKYSDIFLKLNDLEFASIKKYLPNISRLDEIYIYSSLGTSMKYLKYYDMKKDFLQNIFVMILSKDSIFFDEGFKILRTGVQDISLYASILYSIAKGNKKIGDIASFLELKSTYLTRYLQKLVDMRLLKKITPINENDDSKFGRYIICDNFMKFWFLYVFPNYSLLKEDKISIVIENIKESFVKNLLRDSYQDYILELLKNNSGKYLNYELTNIGSWWDNKQNSIDLVAYDRKNISFIKVIWEDSEMAKLEYGKLKINSELFKTSLKKSYFIITKNTFFNLK